MSRLPLDTSVASSVRPVMPVRNALGAPAVSLFLFDRASGGAGFVVSFEHLMRLIFQRADQILDCKTPGCERGCAACVLTSDAPGGKDEPQSQLVSNARRALRCRTKLYSGQRSASGLTNLPSLRMQTLCIRTRSSDPHDVVVVP
jgi:Domain of unknown function (DUF1998)